jgi:NAD(P)-dependent dehydrogenase (short-subunit alcohol dehydrogenase family)
VIGWRSAVDVALEATVVGSFTRVGLRARRALGPWEDLDGHSLTGRSVLVTGATSGLGAATAERLARMGASVRILGRDAARTTAARDGIAAATGNDDVRVYLADMADLAAVRSAAEAILAAEDRLDVLIHNAGALLATQTFTPQGHETTDAAMVLGPALLTERLRPLLARTADAATTPPRPARVILVASGGMYTTRLDPRDPADAPGYRGSVAYARAKRAQVVLAARWGARLAADGIVVHAMHPGWAATPGVHESLPRFERVLGPLLRSPDEGADTIVWLAAADEPAGSTGRFWHDRRARPTHYLPGTAETPADVQALEARVARAIGPFLTAAA